MADATPFRRTPEDIRAQIEADKRAEYERGVIVGKTEVEPLIAKTVTIATQPLTAAHAAHVSREEHHNAQHVRRASGGGFWRGFAGGFCFAAIVLVGGGWMIWKDAILTRAAATTIESRGSVEPQPLHITDGDGVPVHEGGLANNSVNGRPLHAPASAP